jgi:hypothetical protein
MEPPLARLTSEAPPVPVGAKYVRADLTWCRETSRDRQMLASGVHAV